MNEHKKKPPPHYEAFPHVYYDYTSTASLEEIATFYEGHSSSHCHTLEETDGAVCDGRARPFGMYYVYIDGTQKVDGLTTYKLEIAWQYCTIGDSLVDDRL